MQDIKDFRYKRSNFKVLKSKIMKNDTQGNDGQQSRISQQKYLSFYEEHYILEPEDYEKDNGYLEYESHDTPDVVNYTSINSNVNHFNGKN